MNVEHLNLGKEIVSEISKTWSSLIYLNPNTIKDNTLESIGEFIKNDGRIFSDYLFYKYKLKEYYRNVLNEKFEGLWICEWWYDERGPEFQRGTFDALVDYIINIITSDSEGWHYDEENEYYIPKGFKFNPSINQVVYGFNDNMIADLNDMNFKN